MPTAVAAVVTVLVTAFATGAVRTGRDIIEGLISGKPIDVLALPYRAQEVQGHTYILPDALAPTSDEADLLRYPYGVRDPNSYSAGNPDAFESWAHAKGGADPEVSFVKLIVTGRHRTPVRITNISADIVRRGPSLSGTLLLSGTQGGNPTTEIGLDLDQDKPQARTVNEMMEFGKPYFSAVETKTVSKDEQEVFSIIGQTTRHYVEWCVTLQILVDSKPQDIHACPTSGVNKTSAYNTIPGARPGYNIRFPSYRTLYVWASDKFPNGFFRQDPATYVVR